MKFLIFSFVTFFSAIGNFDFDKFDHLDITSDKFDITWDDITEDLWP